MKKRGFFAYNSRLVACGDRIEAAIAEINSSAEANIISWKELQNSGKLIISNIVNEIDESDFFCADLTGLNDNVLFEFGYAVAKKKPVFLIIDTTFSDLFKRFKELGMFDTVGYCSYVNTQDIVKHFHKEQPYAYVGELLFDTLSRTIDSIEEKVPLLIMNSQHNTDFNQEVVNQAEYHKLPAIIDDASETPVQPLSWYIQQLNKVPALLAQFSTDMRTGYELHNAKCSFISGLALGLGLKLKMIAEKPYITPLDFKELLQKFNSRTECGTIVSDFLVDLKGNIAELLVNKDRHKELKRKRGELEKISFGETIAEHESSILYEYYIRTANINSIIKNEYNIVIGRKGTGKTATLFYIEKELRDKRNHVILIRPVNLEVDGLLSLMESTHNDFEKGFLIESIWKFLIYSEIAKSLYEEISIKPLYAVKEEEGRFKKFIETKATIFLNDFSTRLEELIYNLQKGDISKVGDGKNQEYKLRVSELIHQELIAEMMIYFSKIIPKNHSIVVLIDNLDKSWRTSSKINVLSTYLLKLLGVIGRISKELSYIKATQTKISFHLTLFLRTDIYRYMMANAREADKLEYLKLHWDDKDMLFRVIEERFIELSGREYVATDLWDKFLVKNIKGIKTKEYIMSSIFPRPRDIIYFFKSAKDIAISRGHESITEDDIITAHQEYSGWVFKSLIVENGITVKQMESFMYELVACKGVLTGLEIGEKMKKANIYDDTPESIEKFTDYLVELTILGREIKQGQFEYDYDIDTSKKIKVLAQKFGSNQFRIHNALVPFLECTII